MKVILFRDNLKEGLSVAEKAVSENSNLPIIKNVLLKTSNNKIKIITTNLELAITKSISGPIWYTKTLEIRGNCKCNESKILRPTAYPSAPNAT